MHAKESSDVVMKETIEVVKKTGLQKKQILIESQEDCCKDSFSTTTEKITN